MTVTKKSPAQLDAEIAEYLAGPGGDVELEGTKPELAKKLRKAAGIPRTGAQGGRLLGYTASGKPVHESARAGAPDTNNIVTFQKTKAKFPGWTKADHMDAANLFDEAYAVAEAQGDRKRAKDLRRWSSVHWDIGGRWTSPEFEARFGVQRGRR